MENKLQASIQHSQDKVSSKDPPIEDDSNLSTERKNDQIVTKDLKPFLVQAASKFEKINTETPDSQVFFRFFDKSFLSYSLNTVIDACPIIANQTQSIKTFFKEININLPKWILTNDVIEYFLYINDEAINFNLSVRKLLFIADFFENQLVICKIIHNDIIPHLSKDDSLLFLEDSYTKLNSGYERNNGVWFDLFYSCLRVVEIEFQYFLENEYDKIILINKDILEEVIEKYFQLLHNGKTSPLTRQNYIKIIIILHKIRGTTNIYDLIVNEYSRLSSEETIEEFLNLKPTFKIKFKNKINHFYKEFNDIVTDNQFLTFIAYYKNKEDLLNLSFKMMFPQNKENNLKILTVLSVVNVKNDTEKKQVNVRSVSFHKHSNNIFSLPKLSNYMEDRKKLLKKEKFSIQLRIKISYLHSGILNYYLTNFDSFSMDNEITKLSRNTLYAVFQNKYIVSNNDNLITALCNWLNNEKNYNDDILSLIELIRWDTMTLEGIMEFMLKFGKLIENSHLKPLFSNIIDSKLSEMLKNNVQNCLNKEYEKSLTEVIFNLSRKLNFVNINKKENLVAFENPLVSEQKATSVNQKTTDDINKNMLESSFGVEKNTINEMVSEEANEEVFNKFILNNKEEESDDYERDINSIRSDDINIIKTNEDMPLFNLRLNFDYEKFNNILKSNEFEIDPNALHTLVSEYKNSTLRKKCFNKITKDEEIKKENTTISYSDTKGKNECSITLGNKNTDNKSLNVNNFTSTISLSKTIKIIKGNKPSPDFKTHSLKKSNKTISRIIGKSLGDLTKKYMGKDSKNTSFSASKVITCESSLSGTTKFLQNSKEKIMKNSDLVCNSALNIIKAEQSLKKSIQLNKKTKK